MTATVHALPYAPARDTECLNLSPQEVQDAAGGYKRPADQLRELHALGFTRAYIPKVGRKRVVLERAHYESVKDGSYGRRAPRPREDERTPADFLRIQQEMNAAVEAARAAAWLRDAPERAAEAARAAAWKELQKERRAALVRHHTAKRRAVRLKRTPPWADMGAIRELYEEARRLTTATGVQHHVDHEIPLQGRLVSGLHVHNNLQILTGSENSKKKNHFQVEA